MTTHTNLLDLGLRDYAEVWELQRKLVDLRARKLIPDTLIMVEHPHVFTVGKAVPGETPNQIDGVPVFRIERGGQWTYHGLGQLVGYPILDLDERQRDIHAFLRSIEETLIFAVGAFGIVGGRGEQTGVWVGKKKIASIGAAIRNWISFHGFALNVNTDLKYFHKISPCGFRGSTMTSMKAELGYEVNFDEVKKHVVGGFEKAFDVKLGKAASETLHAMVASTVP
jgi:lipoate-protein ligase B